MRGNEGSGLRLALVDHTVLRLFVGVYRMKVSSYICGSAASLRGSSTVAGLFHRLIIADLGVCVRTQVQPFFFRTQSISVILSFQSAFGSSMETWKQSLGRCRICSLNTLREVSHCTVHQPFGLSWIPQIYFESGPSMLGAWQIRRTRLEKGH